VRKYVEMVGLQKLQIQSASLVAIAANPLDFFLAASPSSHHPHRPPGTGQFMVSFDDINRWHKSSAHSMPIALACANWGESSGATSHVSKDLLVPPQSLQMFLRRLC